jgi:hypothetical protein
MATNKQTRSPSKKSGVAEKRVKLVPGDPPIIVGGGGSSLVWIRKDQMPQLIDPNQLLPPNDPNAPPQPTNPGKYHLFILSTFEASSVSVHDGVSPQGSKPVKDKKKHVTYFI